MTAASRLSCASRSTKRIGGAPPEIRLRGGKPGPCPAIPSATPGLRQGKIRPRRGRGGVFPPLQHLCWSLERVGAGLVPARKTVSLRGTQSRSNLRPRPAPPSSVIARDEVPKQSQAPPRAHPSRSGLRIEEKPRKRGSCSCEIRDARKGRPHRAAPLFFGWKVGKLQSYFSRTSFCTCDTSPASSLTKYTPEASSDPSKVTSCPPASRHPFTSTATSRPAVS